MAKRNIAHFKPSFQALTLEISKLQKLTDKILYHKNELLLLMNDSDKSIEELNETIKDLLFVIKYNS